MSDHLILPVRLPDSKSLTGNGSKDCVPVSMSPVCHDLMSAGSSDGHASALVPMARRVGLDAVARAYDAGLSVAVLAAAALLMFVAGSVA